MKLTTPYIKIAEVSYKVVGKKNTPLLELKLVEDVQRKNDNGEYETVGKNFFDAVVWGDKATEGSLELTEGTILDLSPDEVEGNKGSYLKYKAYLEEQTWEYQNKTYSKHVINLKDWVIRKFDND